MAEQENNKLKALSGLIDRKLVTAFLAIVGLSGFGGWAIGDQREAPAHAVQCMTAEQGQALTEAIRANSVAAQANSQATAQLATEIAELRGTINGRRGR